MFASTDDGRSQHAPVAAELLQGFDGAAVSVAISSARRATIDLREIDM